MKDVKNMPLDCISCGYSDECPHYYGANGCKIKEELAEQANKTE